MTMRILVALLATMLTATACNRPADDAGKAADSAAQATESRERDTTDLERRLGELEREWQAMTSRASQDAAAATAAARTAIEEDLKAAREAIAELRTTTAANWWERQERQLERTAREAEQDVRTFARNWTPLEDAREVGTTGDPTDWAQRRDAVVARMEKRIDEMENALQALDPRDASRPEVEQTRARVGQMKEDADRLQRSSGEEWWDVTKAQLNAHLDRLDDAIDRLAAGQI